MEKVCKEIVLSGISKVSPPEICNDGECCDMINLKKRNGILEVCGAPTKLLNKNSEKRVCQYIHKNMNYSNIISYNNDGVYWEGSIIDNSAVSEPQLIATIKNVMQFESIGNILIIICENGCFYALFDKNRYNYMGDIETPDIRFSLNELTNRSLMDTNVYLPESMFGDIAVKKSNHNRLIEYIYSKYNEVNISATKAKKFALPFMVRYALKLYDGTYIKPSAPILMIPNYSLRRWEEHKLKIYSNYETAYIPHFYYNENIYSLMFDTASLPSKEWDDIISSIDIFISKPIFLMGNDPKEGFSLIKDISAAGDNLSCFDVDMKCDYLNDTELQKRIKEETLFFKIASYKISDLRDENLFPESNLREVNIDFELENLATQEILPIDNYSHYRISGSVTHTYNSMLHLGGIRRYLPLPFSLFSFNTEQKSYNNITPEFALKPQMQCHIRVEINTTTGIFAVEKDSIVGNSGYISPYISYPDSRAIKMEIWFKEDNGNNYYISLPLTASEVENCAYYLKSDFSAIEPQIYNDDIPIGDKFCYESFPNMIKVSKIENPIFFPQEQSYTISNSNIIKIATVTKELSQGRYGEFPLYVFCEDGIWTMQQGDNGIVYSSTHPISRDIAISSKSITSIDKAIVFVSTKGIHILNGSETTMISTFGLNRDDIIKDISIEGENNIIVSNQEYLNNFKEFISTSQAGYNYNDNEVLFLKNGYSYIFSLNLETGEWSRQQFTNTPLNGFINNYPQQYICDSEGTLFNYSNEEVNSVQPFLLRTRAIKGIPISYKHLREIILKGDIDSLKDNMSIDILASNLPDRGFTSIGKFVINSSYSDGIRIPITAPPFKYFRLEMGGIAKEGLTFNGLYLVFESKYKNQC